MPTRPKKGGTQVLLVALGFPGSGKTHFARRFANRAGFFHLNSDRVRLALFSEPKYTAGEHRQVFGMMDFLAGQHLARGTSVIYDANSTKRIYRRRLRQIARRAGAKYLLLYFKTPVRVALARLKKRRAETSRLERQFHRPIADRVLFGIMREMEGPARGEPTLVLDGELPYREQAEKVLARLRKSW